MLVIISDTHLTDKTTGQTIDVGAFRVFENRLSDMAYDASKRADGKYKPIDECNVLLLGDGLDLIRSTKWIDEVEGDPGWVRPWHDCQTPDFINKVKAINDDILAKNKESFAVLRRITKGDGVSIPPATQTGKPDFETNEKHPLKINFFYLIGNHDWFYHIPSSAYDEIRQSVVDAMGLAQPATDPFPHQISDNPQLLHMLQQHKVFARHGDTLDPTNYIEELGRAAASLGDVIVVEVLMRFSREVRNKLGDRLPQSYIDGLKELDNVRPALVLPVWISGLADRHSVIDKATRQEVRDIWNGLVDHFFKIDFVKSQDKLLKFDLVDKLKIALKLSEGISFEGLNKLSRVIQNHFWEGEVTWYKQAAKEPALTDPKNPTNYIVYGHTHTHEIVPLNVVQTGNTQIKQMYFNSGTWRRIHKPTKLDEDQNKFLPYQVMTYLSFYKDDERRGYPFDFWSGALGM